MRSLVVFLGATVLLAGCSSSQKQREEERTKLSASAGLYCEFVNGDEHPDIDVEVNLLMARRCDGRQPFTMTNYKNSSDIYGILYCCNLAKSERRSEPPPPPPPPPKHEPEAKNDDADDVKAPPVAPPAPPVKAAPKAPAKPAPKAEKANPEKPAEKAPAKTGG